MSKSLNQFATDSEIFCFAILKYHIQNQFIGSNIFTKFSDNSFLKVFFNFLSLFENIVLESATMNDMTIYVINAVSKIIKIVFNIIFLAIHLLKLNDHGTSKGITQI